MKEQAWLKRILFGVIIVLILGSIKGLSLYKKAFAPNIVVGNSEESVFYIHSGSKYEDVMNLLKEKDVVRNINSLKWVAQKKNYPNHIKPGRYKLRNRMSNNDLINMLRSGSQEPVMLTFNNIRTVGQFAEKVSEQLEFSSDTLLKLLSSDEILEKYPFDEFTLLCMFIPNTYEVYWNISPSAFIDRMYNEYDAFWTKKRLRKLEQIGMSKEDVIILASIVDIETTKDDEKPMIAGVYINRLNRGIRLQADPTVIYAVGDFTMQRVWEKHYTIDSPYNTYKYAGLPPGPIGMPEISSIDAVLDYSKHSYLYFCAKPDFSGYHNFAKTLSEHNRNAQLYRNELNKRRIYN